LNKTTLTFYGGVREVGGNKILLRDGDTRIFLDFGMSFELRRRYYSDPFLSPRGKDGLLKFGILPKLRGIYEFEESEPEVDAVFLSHSHMDHAAYISFLKRSIPIYCGATTERILKALSDIRAGSLEFNIKGMSLKTFRTGDKVRVGSIEVEPIHVDHSVPGSYGFLIHTSSGTVVYTGDFRRHGSKPELTEEFIEEAASERPSALITEGTNAIGVEVSSEPEVRDKINRIVKDASGLVMANFAFTDIDRLRSFYQAAAWNNRYLAITLKQAYLLSRLSSDPKLEIPRLDDERLLIFKKTKKRYYGWEMEAMELGETIDSAHIKRLQSRVILAISFYDLEELIGISPVPGSCYILSASEPFNEEMEIDYEKLVNWLDHYGLPQYHTHVSGHITPLHLKDTLRTISPRKIFLIHGTHLELLSRFMDDLDSEILIPERGVVYEV